MNRSPQKKEHFVKDTQFLRDFINQLTTNNENKEAELPFYRTMFQNLIEKAPVGIYILEEGAYSYVNTYYAALLGYTKEELTQGKVCLDKTIHPDDFPVIQRNIEKRKQGDSKEERYRVRKFNKDGRLIYTEIHTTGAEMYGKTALFGSVIDITEQVVAQQQLQESNEQYKSLFDSSPDAIYSLDDEGRFINVNPASELLTGYSNQEAVGMPFAPLIAPEDLPEAIKHFEEAKKGIPSSTELVLTRKDGKRIHINATHFPMRVNGKIVGTYGTARDITQKTLYEQQIKELAFYDPLTRLPNRKLFEDRLGQIINLSREDRHPFAILFLDLDRFKFINDSLGHHMGDEFLKMVAERLKQTIRKTDTLSRLAGDEFTILLPETSQEEVIRLAERINQVMTEPFRVSGHSVTVSVSIGIAFSKGIGDDVHELIRNADTAMYYTKKFRRNRYTIYSEELDLKASNKLTIERDLTNAIENNELELYYQPIMDLKNEKIIALEALIRWHHPQLGLVPPSDFIPVAEESGQIILIGTWVLETACRQNKIWQDSGIPPFKVAVNISTKQLQQFDFVDSVAKIVEETNLQPEWLELEVTESILLDDVDLIKGSLLKLKKIGVSISIDDFGTGYTSLSYLRQYPFDKVKIDKSFIDDISRDLNGKRITSAIISLAHSLNMNVVAEGIESEIELRYLKEEKCDGGQGYFFSRPLPVHSLQLDLPKI
ncbi:sensor domain-containing protein [Aneurinibacillus tyrosinisolvens]|uniref:sensor domain-containing protein n=1 Tax=Aneurinibacillus tyrosinisolvens TaxID=1443435 RepID=UPI00063FCDE8|nr:EAL domain-containing protein [Aneurinibacillus tyrosinisolvens]